MHIPTSIGLITLLGTVHVAARPVNMNTVAVPTSTPTVPSSTIIIPVVKQTLTAPNHLLPLHQQHDKREKTKLTKIIDKATSHFRDFIVGKPKSKPIAAPLSVEQLEQWNLGPNVDPAVTTIQEMPRMDLEDPVQKELLQSNSWGKVSTTPKQEKEEWLKDHQWAKEWVESH
ncbi:hypothetical protein BU24DRAFT_410232 [Aaosphaeria arxii CBS 175.79]|uniref:Uncharacterized protein n=1 Tax=Aaosphaeria arxii CBS 175.79 TaxID=1450172 RepID=A0A6A5XQ87_9PLEO|nr:uncharacterized protein BU24DRAFT_410232 [Aaosphaeria arxii CBS 175.79]KAF2014494.1 hypothetical protein BU24DRAFT_410232 [Aaosphaeria arxii CBS 175.79]